MGTKYANHVSTKKTSQKEAILGKNQVKNSAGGFSFPVDCWTRLERFLILGNEGGSYYATERKLTQENAKCVLECADKDARRTVNTIVNISDEGRAAKNDSAIFALALLAGSDNLSVSRLALDSLPKVCRTGTHLFQFVDSVQHFRGWGSALKKGVSRWYTEKSPEDLAYQVAKYQSRNGWSHRDVLRKCHAKTNNKRRNSVLRWSVKGDETNVGIIGAFEKAKRVTSVNKIVNLITDNGLPRECIPTKWLNSVEVWEALLHKMPMTALIRNLGKMSNVGLLKPMSSACSKVVQVLGDENKIKKARIHPLNVLTALMTYKAGRGVKGSLSWTPDSNIIDALDDAFYKSFKFVEPTGKRHLIAIDISGSMTWANIAGTFLTPRDAAAALAMTTVKVEPLTHTVVFSSGQNAYSNINVKSMWGVEPVSLSKKMRLDSSVRTINSKTAGGTDCALPMLYAMENKIEVDAFVVLTDNETWFGDIHPCQALQQYRNKMGIPAKLVVVGMVSNNFTIADPKDGGSLDVVGFDSNAPSIIADFVRN